MNEKSLWRRGALIVILCVVLATPANASTNLQSNATKIIIGVVAAAAAVVIITILIIHYSKKQTITGCVNSVGSGMTITDEKDHHVYALTGDTTGVKSGDRMKIQGKKEKEKSGDKAVVWEAKAVTKDFGVCQP